MFKKNILAFILLYGCPKHDSIEKTTGKDNPSEKTPQRQNDNGNPPDNNEGHGSKNPTKNLENVLGPDKLKALNSSNISTFFLDGETPPNQGQGDNKVPIFLSEDKANTLRYFSEKQLKAIKDLILNINKDKLNILKELESDKLEVLYSNECIDSLDKETLSYLKNLNKDTIEALGSNIIFFSKEQLEKVKNTTQEKTKNLGDSLCILRDRYKEGTEDIIKNLGDSIFILCKNILFAKNIYCTTIKKACCITKNIKSKMLSLSDPQLILIITCSDVLDNDITDEKVQYWIDFIEPIKDEGVLNTLNNNIGGYSNKLYKEKLEFLKPSINNLTSEKIEYIAKIGLKCLKSCTDDNGRDVNLIPQEKLKALSDMYDKNQGVRCDNICDKGLMKKLTSDQLKKIGALEHNNFFKAFIKDIDNKTENIDLFIESCSKIKVFS